MHLKQDVHNLHELHDNTDFAYARVRTRTHARMVRGMCMYDATVLAHMLGYCLSIFWSHNCSTVAWIQRKFTVCATTVPTSISYFNTSLDFFSTKFNHYQDFLWCLVGVYVAMHWGCNVWLYLKLVNLMFFWPCIIV